MRAWFAGKSERASTTSTQFVKANQAELPVRALCETLKVSTSRYYDWRDRSLSKRAQAKIALSELIGQAHRTSDQTYSMPRIRAELADELE